MAAALVLGPMLRHVTATTATVWVETDEPCDVEILGHRAGTFTVEGPEGAPTTITVVSGDIHFSYVAGIQLALSAEGSTRLTQVVSSPIRDALTGREVAHRALPPGR